METTTEKTVLPKEDADWEVPAPPTDLIFDDGEPLETNRHRIAMNVLIRSLKNGCASLQDVFVGGNMFIYYSAKQARNRDFKGSCFFVVLGVDTQSVKGGLYGKKEDATRMRS